MLLRSDVTAFRSILVKGHILNKDLFPQTLVCTVAMGTSSFTSLVDLLHFVNSISTLSAGFEVAVFQRGFRLEERSLAGVRLRKHEDQN